MTGIKKSIYLGLSLIPFFVGCQASDSTQDRAALESEFVAEHLQPLEPEINIIPIPWGTTESHIYRPEGAGPFPAIFILQGYPCRTINPSHEKSLARAQLIASYVRQGYLVYMIEKPGMGELAVEAHSDKACEDLTYPEEVASFSAGLEQLKNLPEVIADQVFLFGHSMGGQTAPLIAQDHEIAGIITYGIHTKPWFEFMIDISRAQGERLGMDPVALQGEAALMIPFLYDLMVAKEEWDVLSTRHKGALSIGIMPAEGQRINGRDYRFWSTLNDANFVNAWGAYKGQVLALYGEYDIAAISAEGAERIAHIVNYHNPGNARALILPQADHNLMRFDGSFEEYKKTRFSKDWTGEYVAQNFDRRIADETLNWMKGVREASPEDKMPNASPTNITE